MHQQLSRRSLLIGGSALAVMAACGGDKDDEISVGTTTTDASDADVLSVVMAGSMLQSGIDERITFALFQGVPAELASASAEVKVAFQKPGTQELTEFVTAQRKSEGIDERPYYVVSHKFDAPGDWGLRASIRGKRPGDAVIKINDPAQVAWPTPGKALPSVKTPTAIDTMGVDPICTRSEGTCPFHATSLDAVLGRNNKPTIVLLSTPALCKSAVCGPVLDILMAEVEPVREQLNVVHVEVYTDDTGKKLSDAFAAFKTDSEPAMYFANAKGIVTERFIGPFDRSEAKAGIARLLG